MKKGFFILRKIQTPYDGYWIEALCISTVEKPTEYADTSICVEVDTGTVYKLRGGVWSIFGEG